MLLQHHPLPILILARYLQFVTPLLLHKGYENSYKLA